MKKLITLTALLLCAVVSTWATDVTATWFNGNNSTTATFSPSNDNVAATATAGSGYSIGSTRTGVKLGDGTVTAVNIPIPKSTTVAADAYAELVSFSLSPKTGYDFVPTSINFYAGVQSFGDKTGANNAVIAYEILNGSTTVKAKTNASIGRNDSGTGLTQISVSLSDVTCVSNENLILKIYLRNYSQSSAKNILLYNISFAGSVATSGATFFDMTAAVDDAAHGSAKVSPTSVREGSTATFTAESNTGYKFKNWTNTSTSTVVSTANPYIIASVSEAVSLTANFEAAKAVSYSVSSTNNGTRDDNFATEYADENDKFIAPTNLYLSSDNQTLTGWSDGITTYAIGSEIDCSAGDKTLSPVFTTNSGATFAETLDARTAGFTTTWNFGSNHAMFIMQNTTGYYVKQATINGASVDIPMFINTDPGKFNTEGDNTERAQINNGTILRIPVVDGSVVTLTGLYAFGTTDRHSNSCTQTTINGGTEYDLSNSNKTATYTYSGATGTIDIVVGGDMAWGISLSVTYPSPYSVTYDGNGAESGSVTDASTYDKNASVTTKTNNFTKAGYAFKEWNTEANGSGDSYAAGSKITITDNTTLYAQWLEGTEEAITFVVKTKSAEAATTPSTHLTNLVNETNVGIDAVTDQSKDDRSGKYKTSSNEGEGVQFSFDIAEGYTFQPTLISMQLATVSTTDFTFQVTLTDSKGTKLTSSELNTFTGDGILTDVTFPAYDKIFESGTVTMLVTAVRAGGSGTYRIGKNITITGVARENVTIPVSAAGYATFYTDKALDFTDIVDITAYTATKAGDIVTFNKVTGAVPAETGLLVKADEGNYPIPVAASAEGEKGIMVGTLTGETIAANNFVLLKQDNVIGFYRTAGEFTARANSAWLPASVAGARVNFIGFDEEGEATGIEAIERNQQKESVFNLNGQRVAQPSKGLYIVNGKKVVLK